MKNSKQINFFLRASSVLIVLLSLSLNFFGSNNSTKTIKNEDFSSNTNSTTLNLNHPSFRLALGEPVNNLFFELEEDNDDDTKAHSLAFSCCTQVKSYNQFLVSGASYIKSFLFYQKTPRFILYKNFKDFLS